MYDVNEVLGQISEGFLDFQLFIVTLFITCSWADSNTRATFAMARDSVQPMAVP